ncbi:MAG: hypothetical protein GKR95_03155 [Gammaproteobacteria bacterium]|nr:hypothetical protein [Gammaproteobacteria bacterium]
MKWVAALLMVVNVAIYLSVGSRSVDVDSSVGDNLDVNIEGMLLLNESSKPVSDLQEGIVSAREITPLVKEDTISKILPSGDGSSNLLTDANACYRVGPFKSDETLNLATQWMSERRFEFNQTTSQSRQLKATRVYLGPFDNAASAAPTISQLNVADLDHFVYKNDDGLIRISLGYFTQEGLAEKFLTHLLSTGIEAKSSPDYRQLGPFHWLEVRMSDGSQVLLESQSWVNKGSSVSRMECA